MNSTLRVDNVHEFDGHIACDAASNSEIVVPLNKGTKQLGILDIDSPSFNRFDEEDQVGLELIMTSLEAYL
jgi:GAF domain-containing protein